MLRHKAIVNKNFELFIGKLKERQAMHDVSKFHKDEFDGFAELDSEEVFKLYGTDEYKKRIAENEGIRLHYQRNRHHPEHFVDGTEGITHFQGIDKMDFIDTLEMVLDWKSACETYDTDFAKSVEISIERFKPSKEVEYMIRAMADCIKWF